MNANPALTCRPNPWPFPHDVPTAGRASPRNSPARKSPAYSPPPDHPPTSGWPGKALEERQGFSSSVPVGSAPPTLIPRRRGVGTIGIVDFDVVDESNLQRQVIHGQSDIGIAKAQSARNSMLEINPLITVHAPMSSRSVTRTLSSCSRNTTSSSTAAPTTRHALPRQRRGHPRRKNLRVGLDLPLRRPGVGLLGRCARTDRASTTGTCCPQSPAAGHGALMRRGRCPAFCARRSARSWAPGGEAHLRHRRDTPSVA